MGPLWSIRQKKEFGIMEIHSDDEFEESEEDDDEEY
jgi:hypothetical protein